jgi:putative ABC transport system substrate-binding protein
MIHRRKFITLVSGAAAWPLAASAQQGGRMRRIGVLVPLDENDPVWKTLISAFTQVLAGSGWTEGRNVRVDLRWYGDDSNRARALAQELVGLKPDIILTTSTPATAAGDADNPNCVCGRGRSRRQRPRPAAQPTGWKHYRLRPL